MTLPFSVFFEEINKRQKTAQQQQTPASEQRSWIQDMLSRYRGAPSRQSPQPMMAQVNRPAFDPAGYFRELGTFGEISKSATNVLRQRVANQRMIEAQQQQAINLSGITPQFTGVAGAGQQAPGGKFGSKSGAGNLIQPLGNYSISSGYGPRNRPTAGASNWHRGVDLAAPSGTPIYATHSGVVAFSGWGDGYGNHVSINGSGGLQTFYGHNSRNVVRSGQQVRQGQLIGYVGSTGVSTGPHLHYEVRINGRHVNPIPYL